MFCETLIVVMLLLFFYRWVTAKYNYFANLSIPFVKPVFLFGSMFKLYLNRCTCVEFLDNLNNSFSTKKYFGFFDLREPVYFVRDPELIVQLTIKDFEYFENRGAFVDAKTDSMFGNTLVMMNGMKWRTMRASVSPAFTGSKMRALSEFAFKIANDTSDYLMEQITAGGPNSWNMKEVFHIFSNDAIASCAFGIEINSLENQNNEFFEIAKRAADFSSSKAMLKLLIIKIAPWFLKTFGIEFTDADVTRYVKSTILETIKCREESKIYRPDIINELIQIKAASATGKLANGSSKNGSVESKSTRAKGSYQWTDDEIVAQCFIYFVAGMETTSTLLSLVTYELAVNPNVQQRLFDEVSSAHRLLNGRQPDYDTINGMKYMNQVVSETFRLWPTQPFVNRACGKDYSTVGRDDRIPITIKKGTTFWMPIYTIQRDPQLFPNPDTFDPERFNDENVKNIKPGSYIPFGSGPRQCVGSRFALLKIKAVLYFIVLNFIMEPNERTQIPVKMMRTAVKLRPELDVELDLKPRVINRVCNSK